MIASWTLWPTWFSSMHGGCAPTVHSLRVYNMRRNNTTLDNYYVFGIVVFHNMLSL